MRQRASALVELLQQARLMAPTWVNRRLLLVIFIYSIVALAFALVLADDFGQGWDDAHEAFYGRVISKAYSGSQEYFDYRFQSFFGPAYQLFQYQAVVALENFLPEWEPVHLRYFVNFIVFQMGVIALLMLTKKFTGTLAAATTALLFITQPLLLGHAFINHKDGTFLSLFLVAVTMGIFAVDRLVLILPSGTGGLVPRDGLLKMGDFLKGVPKSWKSSRRLPRWIFLVAAVSFIVFGLEKLGVGLISEPALSLVADAYNNDSLPIVNLAFDWIAEQQDLIPLESYLRKTGLWFDRAALWMLLLSASVLLISARAILGKLVYRPQYGSLLMAIGAAVFLGIATAVRIAGPFAGLLVTLYFLMRFRGKHVWLLLPYFGIAYATTFMLWPALWAEPISHLLETFQTMSQYPTPHRVLYRGLSLYSTDVPPDFVPVLLGIQLTEPVLLLFPVGMLLYAKSLKAKVFPSDPASALVALWLGVPLIAIVVLRLPNFGNFRHYLFAVPPIFLFAAFTLQKAYGGVQHRAARIAIAAIVLIPGVVSIAKLHPYEYVYYNSLVGGVRGAEGKFDLDYWCTSYREAIEFVNGLAPSESEIVVWGPRAAAQTFSRPDLVLLGEGGGISASPDYALACADALRNEDFYKGLPVIHEVTLDGAALARIKARNGE